MPFSRRELLAAALGAFVPDPSALPLERRGRPYRLAPDMRLLALYMGAGWCGPCRAFAPKLVAAYPTLRARGVEVAYVGDDASAAAQADYVARTRMPWPAIPWSSPARRRLRGLGGEALPGLLVLDRAGTTMLTSWRAGRSRPVATLDRLLQSSPSISKS